MESVAVTINVMMAITGHFISEEGRSLTTPLRLGGENARHVLNQKTVLLNLEDFKNASTNIVSKKINVIQRIPIAVLTQLRSTLRILADGPEMALEKSHKVEDVMVRGKKILLASIALKERRRHSI